jgi:hypothetical protein
MSERPEMSEAARRGLQRAGIHFVRAAIEVVNGIGAFVEELQAARGAPDPAGESGGSQRQHIPVEE